MGDMQIVNACHAWFCTHAATSALLFKKRELALRNYEKILARQPRHALTLSRIAFLHAQACDRPRAIAGFERVLAINAEDANSWFNLGYLRQQDGDHALAIEAFHHATQINERHDRAWYGTGLSLIALGQHVDAIAPLQKTAELQPMSPFGYMALARTHFKLGDPERCETVMRRLMGFDPKNAAALEDETGIRIGVDRWWHH